MDFILKKNWHTLLEHVANSCGFPKGSNTFAHCSCSPFLQNKALFHQFSLKENWLQHRGTVTETEESEYDLNKGWGQVEDFNTTTQLNTSTWRELSSCPTPTTTSTLAFTVKVFLLLPWYSFLHH